MKKIFFALFLFFTGNIYAQKFDSIVQTGRVGYHIVSANKTWEGNQVSISPIGFTGFNNILQFYVNGKVRKVQIDDFNNDGYPDMILYAYDDRNRAQVYALASGENKSVAGIKMNDVYSDPKLRNGYEGNDSFSIIEGILYRTFPVYNSSDSVSPHAIIGKRVIQYKAAPEANGYVFKVMNVFEEK